MSKGTGPFVQTASPRNLSSSQPVAEINEMFHTTSSILTADRQDVNRAERVERAMQATGYGVLRNIQVIVDADIVYLVGCVPTYYLKQIAQATALAIPGIQVIHNRLDVIRPH